MDTLLGFKLSDLRSWKKFVSLLHQPKHASILAFARIAFGFLMMVDIPQERGMSIADVRYGEEAKDHCRFPLFSGLQPLSADYMILLYSALFISAVGIMLGFFYRLSCFCFIAIYWYFFFLDKSTWNNHGYLYGLLGFLFFLTDAHRYMSIDGMLDKSLRNSHVPLWNYTLFRFQIFLVYFYAGLKKTELDWLTGHSMGKLSRHWVFDPMKIFLDDSVIDLVVVHFGGFMLDLSAGFLLFFDKTRYIGFFFVGMFHLMNSQLFNIGMFPYAMIATMFVFCADNSFNNFLEKLKCWKSNTQDEAQINPSCVYKKSQKEANFSWKQYFAALLTVVYICEQLFLPYSHFITKGYNGWTVGPYGYSWDMMVHSFNNQHIKIKFVDKFGKEGYLKPGSFLQSSRSRWASHPDMTIQYARCLKDRLVSLGIEEPSIYIDVWISLNRRFQQRVIDSKIDLANYDWSPFKSPEFVLPVITELSSWRSKLLSMRSEKSNQTNIVFVADFPEMVLDNFVQPDFTNTTIEVLQGSVAVEIPSENQSVPLSPGNNLTLPAGTLHSVSTTSSSPSCFFYVYRNFTALTLQQRVEEYKKKIETSYIENWSLQSKLDNGLFEDEDPLVVDLYYEMVERKKLSKRSLWKKFNQFIFRKCGIFRRSFLSSCYALRNVVLGRPDDSHQVLMERRYIDDWMLASREDSEKASQSDDSYHDKTEL